LKSGKKSRFQDGDCADARGLAVRLAKLRDVEAVKGFIRDAVALARSAKLANDLRLLRRAVELKTRAARVGGRLLPAEPSSVKRGAEDLARWRSLAAMKDDEFEVTLSKTLMRQSTVMRQGNDFPRIAMHLSAWFLDEHGNPTRILSAADVTADHRQQISGMPAFTTVPCFPREVAG
jgi:hypothetical protein